MKDFTQKHLQLPIFLFVFGLKLKDWKLFFFFLVLGYVYPIYPPQTGCNTVNF